MSLDPGFVCDLQSVWDVFQVNFVDESASFIVKDAQETIFREGQEDGIGANEFEALDGTFLRLETTVTSFLEQIVRLDDTGKISENDETGTFTS